MAETSESKDWMLSGVRVLDLTDEKGFLTGKVLGDLGADVLKIEPPGGEPARRLGPFYKNEPDPEKSLYWLAYNVNKRGVTLDITTETGREILKRFVKTADFLVESSEPGTMEKLGLGYKDLETINPRIIVVSITPFGQKGPRRKFKATDLEINALSGFMSLLGDPERPPVRISIPQSYMWGAMYAAMGAMMAHYYRGVSGVGQHVDASCQAALIWAGAHAPAYWDLNRENIKRAGPYITGRSVKGAKMRAIYPCKDGFINFIIYGGPMGIRTNKSLAKWMEEEGEGSPALSNRDWDRFNIATVTQQEIDEMEEPIARFLGKKTRQEFFEGVIRRNMLGYPVATPRDILADEQLQARHYWKALEHPELGDTITYPGAFCKFSGAQCGPRFRAPRIGEHNSEVYAELGFTSEELARLKESNVI